MSPHDADRALLDSFRADPRSYLRLIAIADRTLLGTAPLAAIAAAIRGGATAIQLRDKRGAAAELFALAVRATPLCREAGVPLFVNDRPDVALAAGAHGVHVGPADLPPEAVRRLGGRMLLGVSARTGERLEAAERSRADYVGIGAYRSTESKEDAVPLARATLGALIARASCPAVVIGGVRPEDVREIRELEAAGIAVLGGIFAAADPAAAARAYREAWDGAVSS